VDFADEQRGNGPSFVEVAKFSLECALTPEFQIPRGSPPRKLEEKTCFLDPWGRRYVYYYKPATDPEAWRAVSYLLYSIGPDGLETPPDPLTGLYPTHGQASGGNTDNVYASSSMP